MMMINDDHTFHSNYNNKNIKQFSKDKDHHIVFVHHVNLCTGLYGI